MNTYEYSVIRVEPDLRRGERVNVGIVVFDRGGLDIRVVETRKASTIATKDWDAHIQLFSTHVQEYYGMVDTPSELVTMAGQLDRQINLTEIGWFRASDTRSYEAEVNRILSALVKRPAQIRPPKDRGITADIAASFRSADVLADRGMGLESGKIIRNYIVDEDAGLSADFALKNGSLHLASAVDLTSTNPHFGSAASAAVTLDRAKKSLKKVKAYGVYAVAPSRKSEVKEHIAILGDYSDDIFNWHDRDEKDRFKRTYFDAYNSHNKVALENSN